MTYGSRWVGAGMGTAIRKLVYEAYISDRQRQVRPLTRLQQEMLSRVGGYRGLRPTPMRLSPRPILIASMPLAMGSSHSNARI
jgi:hypothetical protein